MKFIDKMIARKAQSASAESKGDDAVDSMTGAPVATDKPDTYELNDVVEPESIDIQTETETSLDVASLMAMVSKPPQGDSNSKPEQEETNAKAEAPQVNIWDLDAEDDDTEVTPPAPPPVVEPPVTHAPDKIVTPIAPSAIGKPKRRPGRVKTRLLGFEHSDDAVVDLFDPDAAVAKSRSAKFPVGWVVVVDGPGRGESFALLSGMSQIGRGDDQAIQLNFGDNSISRDNHAAIAYDPENHSFLLGHGGKSNIVRLNDKPVLSTEELKDTDLVRIGETTLRFIALCNPQFNWVEDKSNGDDDDVAIA